MQHRECRAMARGGRARVLAAMAAMAVLVAVPATVAAQAPTRSERDDLLRDIEAGLVKEFSVPTDIVLDPSWRDRVEALSREHRARVVAWAAAWLDGLPNDPGRRAGTLIDMLAARYFNELVAWQIDRVDDADDARLLGAMADPGVCAAPAARNAFKRWIVMLQSMPETDREPALRAQALLLSRWGRPRPDLPARPAEALLPSARAAIAQLRALDRPDAEPPAPPVLMWSLMPGKETPTNANLRCALAAWALQRAPLRDAPSPERARTLRFALAWDPLNDTGPSPGASTGDDYPAVARRFGVQGTVRVVGRVAPSGTGLVGARVASRNIRVDGLDAVRPVAFETALDDASLQRAATTPIAGRAPGDTTTLEFAWKLQ